MEGVGGKQGEIMLIIKMSHLAAAPRLNLLAVALLCSFLCIFTVTADNVIRGFESKCHTWDVNISVISVIFVLF